MILAISNILIEHGYCESKSESDLINTCPTITCSEPLGNNVCFMHSGTNPVEWMKFQPCPSGMLCEPDSPQAWFTTQGQTILGSSNPESSPTWRK